MFAKRPGTDSSTTTTPQAADLIAFFGVGIRSESVALTRDEFQAINKLYGYVPEKSGVRPPEVCRCWCQGALEEKQGGF